MTVIGRLERICRFPVKSMAGEELNSVFVHETGINGDRVFALYHHGSKREGLPYWTGREKAQMILLKPKIVNESDPTKPYPEGYKPRVVVTLPNGSTYDIDESAFLVHIRELSFPKDVSLTVDYRRAGMQDGKPISLMGLQTVELLSQQVGVVSLDPLRFRENFYVDWINKTPFFEDDLVGRCLQIGQEVLIHVVKRNERCPMICLDPTTSSYYKRVLGVVAKQHEMKVGVYAMVRRTGVVRKGDEIVLL